jgi:predicted MPP superfamily phosphohydrolase
VFAVPGNHVNPAATATALASGNVRLLVGQRVDAGPVQIVGADSITRGSPAVEAMRRAIAGAARDRPVLVIAHEPIFFTWLRPAIPVLMLAGHTHGGQIHLPVIGSWQGDPYYSSHRRGLFAEGRHRLIVSSGLGTSYLPMRIGVPPEIVEVTLVPAPVQLPGRKSGTDR